MLEHYARLILRAVVQYISIQNIRIQLTLEYPTGLKIALHGDIVVPDSFQVDTFSNVMVLSLMCFDFSV